MALRLLGLLALLAGCTKGPAQPFDAGNDVHVIIKLSERPKKTLSVRPVATIGPLVAKARRHRFGPKGPDAVEVAILRSPRGEHRFSVWEPLTWTGVRATVEVEGDLWVVMEIRPGAREGELTVYNQPPHEEIGNWTPLIPVPD